MPIPTPPPPSQDDPSDQRRVDPGDVCIHVMYLDRAGLEQKMTIHFSQALETILGDIDAIKQALAGTVEALGGTILVSQLEILTTQPMAVLQPSASILHLNSRSALAG